MGKIQGLLKPSYLPDIKAFTLSSLKTTPGLALMAMFAAVEVVFSVFFAPISFSTAGLAFQFQVCAIDDTPSVLLFGWPAAIGNGLGIIIANYMLGYGLIDSLNGGVLHTLIIRALIVVLCQKIDKSRSNWKYQIWALYTTIVATFTVAWVISLYVPVGYLEIALVWLLPSIFAVQHIAGAILYAALKRAGVHMVFQR